MHTDQVLQLLQDVAANVIQPRFQSLAGHEVTEKAPGDLVTIADQEAEQQITATLHDRYPHAVVLGEEAFALNPQLLGQFMGAAHGFTVDPVDGTQNFVNGSVDYAVMVSEHRKGTMTRAWIWQPEHHRAYVAVKDQGAWCNGEPISWKDPRNTPGVTANKSWVGGRVGQFGTLNLTWVSCGIDYPYLINGAARFALYASAQPWDHLPGALLVAEAGGLVTTMRSQPFGVGTAVSAGSLVCSRHDAQPLLAELIRNKFVNPASLKSDHVGG
jgi:fructose-1,6-bisphosphatase/inositol monophosphatase family enzyme